MAVALVPPGPATAGGDSKADRGVIVAERSDPANGDRPQLVSVDPRSGRVKPLTSGYGDRVPDISPDGQRIVFERCFDPRGCSEYGTSNIWIMKADGSDQRALTTCDGTQCLGNFEPSFSPDGRLIAFARDQFDENGVNFEGIFIMRADGTHLRRITANGPDNLPDLSPRFSPDGRRLVFERELPGGFSKLMVVNVDGSGLRELLPGLTVLRPDWSPDGKRIAFTWVRDSGSKITFEISVVRPDGSRLRVVTNEARHERAAIATDYSPDGDQFVYSAYHFDAPGCSLVTVSTSGRHRRVISSGTCLENPSWGPTK